MKIKNPINIWQLSFEGDWPTSVTFLDDGRKLAAGNRNGDIYYWELPEKLPVAEESGSPADKNGKKRLPDMAPVRRLEGHTNGITHLRYLSESRSLVSASLDHSIRIWNVNARESGSRVVVLDAKSREQRARYKPREVKEKILNAPGQKVTTVQAIHILDRHKGWVNGLDVTPDGQRMVSGDDQCLSIVWDFKTRKPISEWKGYDRVWVRSSAISPDGKQVFTGEYAGRRSSFDVPAAQARLWNADDGKLQRDLLKIWTPNVKDKDRQDTYNYGRTWGKLLKRGLVCAAFSPDGKILAVGQGGETDTGKIHLINLQDGKILRSVSGHRYGVCDVKFSADGKYVLSSGRDTVVRISNVADGKEIASLGKERGGQFKDWIHAIAVSPDQKFVAGADIAGKVHIWQLES